MPAITTPWKSSPAMGAGPMRSQAISSNSSAPAPNIGNESTICHITTRVGSMRRTNRALSARRSPSITALDSTIQLPAAPGSRTATSASPRRTSEVPAIATNRPSALAAVIRSPAMRKCANIAANNGLVAMSTDPIAPEVRSNPTFIDAICTAKSSAVIHSAPHSPFSGRSRTPRQRAHNAMQAIPIAKRRNAVVSGGKATRENLTATGLPPHSEWMTIETSTAPRGTASAMREAPPGSGCSGSARPVQAAVVKTILPLASRPRSRCIASAATASA